MADLNDSFDALMDPDMWVDVAAVGAGFMGASLAQSALEGVTPFDVPNAAYGVAFGAGAYAFSPAYRGEMLTGGMLYSIDALAQRFNLKQQVTQLGQSSGGS